MSRTELRMEGHRPPRCKAPATGNKQSTWVMVVCVFCLWLQFFGACMFVYGFFSIQTEHHPPDHDVGDGQDVSLNETRESAASERLVGQLLIVVIDALRADFVFENRELVGVKPSLASSNENSSAPKIRALRRAIEEGRAVPMLTHVHPPTVTLPKIKTMMSGSIPGMGDFINNFFAGEVTADSLISRWRADGRRLTMFGDDTWLRLFPGAFDRSDGTHSFFVTDFYEVDANVTRHVVREMSAGDWDVCVLHYLGLDHVGHVEGPRGPTVRTKLDEMSQVIEMAQKGLFGKGSSRQGDPPPMILVLGDHGMSDDKGHGGSSVPESTTPLVFITHEPSSKPLSSQLRLVNQQDIAPTLAILTGVPIPKASIGLPIEDIMTMHGVYDRAVASNSRHIANLYQKTFPEDDAPDYATFVSASKDNDTKRMDLASRNMASRLQDSMLTYRMEFVALALAVEAGILLYHASRVVVDLGSDVLLAATALRTLTYLSTSFIEEEHQSFYFMATTVLALRALASKKLPDAGALLILGVARRWNQTGDKWRHLPDIADTLRVNPALLTTVFVGSILGIMFITTVPPRTSRLSLFVLAGAFLGVYIHKASQGSVMKFEIFGWPFGDKKSVTAARLVYTCAVMSFLVAIFTTKSRQGTSVLFMTLLNSLLTIWTLIMPAENSALVWMSLAIHHLTTSSHQKHAFVRHYLLGWAIFFAMGNSNSPSTVNLDAGYQGMTEFNTMTVPLLIDLNLYCGPLLWLLLFVIDCRDDVTKLGAGLETLCLLRSAQLSCTLAVTTAQRYHLFVLTVFSPKVLYELNTSFIYAVFVTLIYIVIKCLPPNHANKGNQ